MKMIKHINEIQKQVPGAVFLENQNHPVEEIVKINEELPTDFTEFFSFIGNSSPLIYSMLQVGDEEYAFDWFYDIEEINKSLEDYEDRMPTWLIPFAPDYMGNEFVISVREKDYGSVYLWEHDYEYDEDQDDCPLDEYEGNLICMASSFTEFILKMELNAKYLED